MTGERLVRRFEVKEADVDTAARTFSGLASTWERDLQDDIIERGAFRKTLRTWGRKGGPVIPLLDSHGYFTIRSALGKLVDAEERDAGLWTQWDVVDGEDGDAALSRIEAGIVDSLSIGYRPVKWKMVEDAGAAGGQVRQIKELDLKEVSLVMFPANPGARIGALKEVLGGMSELEKKAVLQALQGENVIVTTPEGWTPDEDEWRKWRSELQRATREHQKHDVFVVHGTRIGSAKEALSGLSEVERNAVLDALQEPTEPERDAEPEPRSGPATYDPEKAAALTGRLAARRFARRLEPLRRGRP